MKDLVSLKINPSMVNISLKLPNTYNEMKSQILSIILYGGITNEKYNNKVHNTYYKNDQGNSLLLMIEKLY